MFGCLKWMIECLTASDRRVGLLCLPAEPNHFAGFNKLA